MINYKDFEDKEMDRANKLVSYYNGDQLRFVRAILDGKMGNMGKRKKWKKRGFIPRSRNVTKAIIDKSGPIFNNPPKLEIWKEDAETPIIDETFNELMYKSDWLEFFQNVSPFTRLVKSTAVLIQKYIPEDVETVNGEYRFDKDRGDSMILTLLHRGNSVVKTNIVGDITELAYLIEPDASWVQPHDEEKAVWYYRRIDPMVIEDVRVEVTTAGMKETIMDSKVNEDKVVPAVMFYDTTKPTNGVWCQIPEDLESFQEFYNLHLTDTEYAIAHQKQKTLFTNTKIESAEEKPAPRRSPDKTTVEEYIDHYDPTEQYHEGEIGGLGSVVTLENDGSGNTPYVEFKGPESDLDKLDQIAKDMMYQIADDYSVNLKIGGNGSANSGFQLMVEEIDNLTLREKRVQSFQAGFRKFYDIMRVLYPELSEGTLLVEFAPPSLPVNHKEQEETWSLKIAEGRASRIDYFMEVHQMSRDEAEAKVKEIDDYQEEYGETNLVQIPDFNQE